MSIYFVPYCYQLNYHIITVLKVQCDIYIHTQICTVMTIGHSSLKG
jgi:hypothetical protein